MPFWINDDLEMTFQAKVNKDFYKVPKCLESNILNLHHLIVGEKPITFKKAFGKFCDYLEDHELMFKDTDNVLYFDTDSKLKKIFNQDEVLAEEALKIIKDHLKVA